MRACASACSLLPRAHSVGVGHTSTMPAPQRHPQRPPTLPARSLHVATLSTLATTTHPPTHTHTHAHTHAHTHQVALEVPGDLAAARLAKARLERTTLGQVARDIRLHFQPGVRAGAGDVRGCVRLCVYACLYVSVCVCSVFTRRMPGASSHLVWTSHRLHNACIRVCCTVCCTVCVRCVCVSAVCAVQRAALMRWATQRSWCAWTGTRCRACRCGRGPAQRARGRVCLPVCLSVCRAALRCAACRLVVRIACQACHECVRPARHHAPVVRTLPHTPHATHTTAAAPGRARVSTLPKHCDPCPQPTTTHTTMHTPLRAHERSCAWMRTPSSGRSWRHRS
jgi:hypothetical protein